MIWANEWYGLTNDDGDNGTIMYNIRMAKCLWNACMGENMTSPAVTFEYWLNRTEPVSSHRTRYIIPRKLIANAQPSSWFVYTLLRCNSDYIRKDNNVRWIIQPSLVVVGLYSTLYS